MPSQSVLARRERLHQLLEARGLAFVLVSNPVNIYYLTGFRGSAGLAVFGRGDAVLWVDPRYILQAREQAHGMDVIEERRSLLAAAAKWLVKRQPPRVGYDDEHLSSAAHQALVARLRRGVRLVPAGGLVEELRYIKDVDEIAWIRKAGHLTASVFEEVAREVRPGVREADVAAELEYRLRRRGADGVAFETIVASGPRAAWPHAGASSKLLKKSELVILDLGAILSGYAADMTRTLFLGEPGRRVRSLYNAVLEAQQCALGAISPGRKAGDVDSVARRSLEDRGLARFFTHSTGHGVGLEVHEMPRLARREKQRLEAGCVVTVEPGVYLEGLGGIRIEDTVLVRADGSEILTPASKGDWYI